MSTPQRIGPDTVIGDFKILRPLAKGAMGAVYIAEQISTGVERALKVMHPQLMQDPKSVERFKQEARVCARLDTDHVVKILGAGADQALGVPWIAMELLKGRDLGSIAKERGKLPLSEIREIFAQLCSGLGVAHKASIVHRDLKLENIFVADAQRPGVPFTVKILDFGISKVVENFDAAATAAIGSPMWMAPEQAKKGTVTPAADIWPLGLIAFRLITGRLYWKSAANERPPVREVLMEVIVAPLDPPSARAREFGITDPLPAGFDAWFLKCVARDPAQRFADADEVLNALLPVLSGTADASGPARAVAGPAFAPAPLPAAVVEPPHAPPIALPATTPAPVAAHPPPQSSVAAFAQTVAAVSPLALQSPIGLSPAPHAAGPAKTVVAAPPIDLSRAPAATPRPAAIGSATTRHIAPPPAKTPEVAPARSNTLLYAIAAVILALAGVLGWWFLARGH